MGLSVFVVAGEASADLHGAHLLRELKRLAPDVHAWGVGAEKLRAEGMEVVVDAQKLNVVGIFDWLDRFGEVWGSYRFVLREIERRRPDVAVLLDLPDFNLLVAKRLKALGIPVVYYISPQVWAWRKYRVKKIRRRVDRMLVLFPFEKEFYDRHRVPVTFTGHPLRDSIRPRSDYRSAEEITAAPRVALLPGSRRSELRHLGPILDGVARLLVERFPSVEIQVPVARTLSKEAVRAVMPFERIQLTDDARDTVRWADAALVASGTATLETALVGTPLALVYVVNATTMAFVRAFIRYKGFLGMPNLLHGREVVREYWQEDATPPALVDECERLLFDETYRGEAIGALRQSRDLLGTTEGASARAAVEVWNYLRAPRAPMGSLLASPQPA